MLRWLWLVLAGVGLAVAGPFEKVPGGDAAYRDLAFVREAGLGERALVRFVPGDLTRFECALIWKAAYDEIAAALPATATTVGRPNRTVTLVAEALLRLLTSFESELAQMDVRVADARSLLGRLPERLAALPQHAPRRAAPGAVDAPVLPAPSPSAAAPLTPTTAVATSGSLAVESSITTLPGPGLGTAEAFGARWTPGRLGPAEAGVSVREVKLFESDGDGPVEFLSGHVLAADLRLKLGDNSVLLEYARSVNERLGSLVDPADGAAFRASFAQRLNDRLTIDLGFRRLSPGFAPYVTAFSLAEAPSLYGVEAGLVWSGNRLGVTSRGSVFRPEGQRVGYANRFEAEMGYRITRDWRLHLGYQTSTRRRLASIEDLWLNSLTAGLSFGSQGPVRADLSYRFDITDSPYETDRSGHTFGASLGLGF